MRVAIITRHAINNYGSLLQALATQEIIERFGNTCEIIDYVRDDETYKKREKTLLARKDNWNSKPVKRIIYLLLRQPESILAGRRFEKMQKEYLNLTRRYSSKEELLQDKPIADCYVTGSDQVWGPVENGTYDDCYCLSFTDNNDRRIAYGASFGRTEFTNELDLYFRNWFERYDSISVREDSAVEYLKNLGLNAEQVIDPTLLLPQSFWRKYVYRKIKDDYILIYQLHKNNQLGKYARKLAQRENLKLIRVSSTLHQIIKEGKLIWCPDINEFLSLIAGARCVVTDSFHGTAFAINLNVPFIEILPTNKTSTRNMSILRLTGLTDRILDTEDDFNLINREIDYDVVNKIIYREREKSLSVFEKMLSQRSLDDD